jgi:hypothetical protein
MKQIPPAKTPFALKTTVIALASARHLFSTEGCFGGRQMKRPACHHEFAFALMMNRPGPFPRWINPRLDDFHDEEVVKCHDMGMTFAHPARIVVSSTTGPGSSSR